MSDQRYLVAARKYRPQRFDEVVAQEHVCDTLKNAIGRDRVGHAYLFSGPRGVGKTTVARILAKSINCMAPLEERDGAEPCQQCDSCLSFVDGRNLNVIEIDAASNNRVDDARELRDTVRVPPQGARKKVYIVDEVHMLTTQAFNALLKTLEEPPPYVLFIFATTEPNKVIPTITSRCQRFDFRRIPVAETVERLEVIAGQEGIRVDEASLLLIAQKGDGALRDALSVFDQAVALCGEDVTYDTLADALGVVDIELYFEATRHVRDANAAGVLDLVRRVVAAGFDLREFLAGLSEHLRNLLVAVTMPDTTLIETSSEVRKQYKDEGAHFSHAALLRLLSVAAHAESTIRSSVQPRLQLELGLLKMVSLANTVDLRQALDKLDQLAETNMPGGIGASKPGSPGSRSVSESKSAHRTGEGGRSASTARNTADRRSGGQQAGDAGKSEDDVGNQRHAVDRNGGKTPGDDLASEQASQGDDLIAGMPRDADSEKEQEVHTEKEQEAEREKQQEADTGKEQAIPTGRAQPPQPAEAAEPSGDGDLESTPEIDEAALGSTPGDREEEGSGETETGQATGVPDLFGPPALTRKPRKNNSGSGMIEGTAARSALLDADEVKDDGGAASDSDSITSWLPFVKTVKAERIHVGSLLQHTAPSACSDSTLLIDVPDDFHKRLLENQQDFLLRHARELISASLASIRFVVRQSVKPREGETADDFDPYEYMQRKRQSNPVIKAIFDDFGGEVVW